MKKEVTKAPKVALCRVCRGTGRTSAGVCPQCEGSGRVTVSAKMEYDIRAYKPGEQ